MAKSSTHETLLLHLFNELPPVERNLYEHLLISDVELQQEYSDYTEIVAQLQIPLLEPSNMRVQQLLDYASSV